MKCLAVIGVLLISFTVAAQPAVTRSDTTVPARQLQVHDPALIRAKDRYYLFCTGRGIRVFSSADLKTWKREEPVFKTSPDWAVKAVPGYNGHTWAPDISFHNGRYYLYYSVSLFGKNRSCIGLLTNKTLDPQDPAFRWEDQGMVLRSVPGRDPWNAIDPNLIIDEKGLPWLSFGSFWNGIQILQLERSYKKPVEGTTPQTIASRVKATGIPDAGGAIEAPFIFRKGAFYYLFASWDYCCKGWDSNYKVVTGRSRQIAGPYLDKEGHPMAQNGGSVFVRGDGREWMGIGHNAVFTDTDGTDYFVAHGYDGYDNGKPKLLIRKIRWDQAGWPFLDASPE